MLAESSAQLTLEGWRQTDAMFFALGPVLSTEPETCSLPPLREAEMETGTPWKQTN